MSSILSDIFYGSKQHLLNNYLINPNASKSNTKNIHQPSQIYASQLEFLFFLGDIPQKEHQQLYQIVLEMGTHSDQNFLQPSTSPNAHLSLNHIESQDLNQYSNIKVTVSQGKHKNTVCGFIPIQILRELSHRNVGEKNIVIQLKGKKALSFQSMKCTIRAEFPSNNFLNSELLKSQNKNESKSVSNINQYFYKEDYYLPKFSLDESHKPPTPHHKKTNQSHQTYTITNKRSSNSYSQSSISNARFTKQVRNTKIYVVQVKLKQDKEEVRVQLEGNLFAVGDEIQVVNIGSRGVRIHVEGKQGRIGYCHLSAILLARECFDGQFPIYNHDNDNFEGTLILKNTLKTTPTPLPTHQQKSSISSKPFPSQSPVSPTILTLHLQKILLLNEYPLLLPQNQNSEDPYNLLQMQQRDKIQILVRINQQIYSFANVCIKVVQECQMYCLVELRRKDGFVVEYCCQLEEEEKEGVKVEVEVYSGYQLFSYSRLNLKHEMSIQNHFAMGQTQAKHCQVALHLQHATLTPPPSYFPSPKHPTIHAIISTLLTRSLTLTTYTQAQIHKISSLHPEATFIQIKKLLNYLKGYQKQINIYQNQTTINLTIKDRQRTTINRKLIRQFKYLDYSNRQVISSGEFKQIMQFYAKQLEDVYGEQYSLLVEKCMGFNGESSDVAYLFALAGIYYDHQSHQSLAQQNSSSLPQQPSKQESPLTPPNPIKQQIHNPIKQQIEQYSPPPLQLTKKQYLQKVVLSNTHFLLPNSKIPNISINLCKKIYYSKSNPEFIIDKEIELNEGLKVYHKSIADNRLVLIAHIKLNQNQAFYQLEQTGKSFAKLYWKK